MNHRGRSSRDFGLLILSLFVLSGMGQALACTAVPLSAHQIRVKEIFDIWDRMLNDGDGFTQLNNRNGILANGEPKIISAYLRMYEATRDVKYLRKAVVHGDRILAHRDDHAGHSDYRGRSGPVWSNKNPKYVREGKAYPFVLDSGELIRPLAYFAYLVRKEECLQRIKMADGRTFSDVALHYINKVRETIRFHHENWRIDSVKDRPIGFYILPDDADFVVGIRPTKPVPTNFQTAMGSALVSLYLATKYPFYKKRSDRIGYFLLEEIENGPRDYSVFNY